MEKGKGVRVGKGKRVSNFLPHIHLVQPMGRRLDIPKLHILRKNKISVKPLEGGGEAGHRRGIC